MTANDAGKKDYLYRYQSLDEKYLDVFSKKELFFSSPIHLNDPFDCKAFLTYKNCTIDDLFNYIFYQVKRGKEAKKQSATEEDLRKEALDLLHRVLEGEILNGNSFLSQSMEDHKNKFLEDICGLGILSLSERKDDLLMWAHYAACHKGYCLEFDKEKLEEWVKSIRETNKFIKLAKVIYNESYPTLRDYMEYVCRGPGSSLDELFLLRKSSHWEYEKEWRIIISIDVKDSNSQRYQFPENMLTGVILGLKFEQNESIIRDRLKTWGQKPKFYYAYKDKNKYAVYIKEAD